MTSAVVEWLAWSLSAPWARPSFEALRGEADDSATAAEEQEDEHEEEEDDACSSTTTTATAWQSWWPLSKPARCSTSSRRASHHSAASTSSGTPSSAKTTSSVGQCSSEFSSFSAQAAHPAQDPARRGDLAPLTQLPPQASQPAPPQHHRGRRSAAAVWSWIRRASWRAGGAVLVASACVGPGRGQGPLKRAALLVAGVAAWRRAARHAGGGRGGQHASHGGPQGLQALLPPPRPPGAAGAGHASAAGPHGARTGRGEVSPLSADADLLITSFAHASPAVLAWLTPDVARRLVAQCGGDVPKARDKVCSIHAWRQQMGLDLMRFPPWPHQARPPHHLGDRHGTLVTHHPAPRGGQHLDRAAAVRAAAHTFGPTSRAIGLTLLHTDDARGLAVLWIEGACMCNTRKVLSQQLLEEQREARAEHRASSAQAASQPVETWLHRITLHVALLSTWLWGTRLSDQPLSAGRFVQVIDLQGVPTAMLMCGDGLAIIKAIMGAAHQFPQRLLATVVIHPPRGLAVAWAVVSKLLPPPVQQKIRFIRSHEPQALRAELLTFIPEELLPVELGGKRVSASKGSAAAEGAGSASPAAQLELESALAACVFVPDVE